jgi:hypothetical protein
VHPLQPSTCHSQHWHARHSNAILVVESEMTLPLHQTPCRYLAIVKGRVGDVGTKGVIDVPLKGKPAITEWEVVEVRAVIASAGIAHHLVHAGLVREERRASLNVMLCHTCTTPESQLHHSQETPSATWGTLQTLSLWPKTGRTHQLRRHLAETLATPILGERPSESLCKEKWWEEYWQGLSGIIEYIQ